jgi:protein disulfide-isomerase
MRVTADARFPIMKRLIFCLLGCFAAIQVALADDGWMTDLAKAQARAKKEKKLVFVDFTGSDWCPPCMALHKTILITDEFKKYAQKSLVLVEMDFPTKKAQSADLKKANEQVARTYHVEGYPTVLVLDADGKELHRQVGFSATTPKEYIAALEKALKK